MKETTFRAIRLIITGRVQGVFFRQATLVKARSYALQGFVTNLPDGAVMIEAQGSEENLEQLFRWCHHGPIAAKVRTVTREDIVVNNNLNAFMIRR